MANKGKISGGKLKDLRLLLRKTQKDWAKELDTTQANISQIENDECTPGGQFFNMLAERYPDVNFNWLIFGEGDPLRKKDKESLVRKTEADVEKRVEKKYDKIVDELKTEIDQLKQNNSKLIDLAHKGKK